MDKIDCMRAFRQVVESNGYAAAAREMGLTRSTVNKQVSYLEKMLQTQLLIRSTRKVRPSETGMAFYQKCLSVLNEYDAALSAVSQLQQEPRGQMRINAPMTFGTLHLSPIVAAFVREYESIFVELVLADRLVDPIEEGFDVTIRIAESQHATSLISREIATSDLVICASPGYLERFGTPTHPGELVQHRCLQYGYGSTGGHWQLGSDDNEMSVPINIAMRANNAEVLRDVALNGAGIVLVPTFIANPALSEGRLVEVLPAYRPRRETIYAIYPRHRHLSSKVQLFVQYVSERLGESF